MKENIKLYTLGSLVFICILSFSSMTRGILSELIRILAFLLPAAALIFYGGRGASPSPSYLSLKKEDATLLLPLILPSLFLIFFTSFLSYLLINSLTGAQEPSVATGSLSFDLYSLAIIPAVLEELLFRYVPLKIIAPHSKKSALFISIVFFALVHSSFFSIPHAALAGGIFMLFDIVAESVYPSVILHFINNLISIVWIYNSGSQDFASLFWILFAIGAFLSLIPIFVLRKTYLRRLKEAFDKDDKTVIEPFCLALAVPCLISAILGLI